MSATPREDAPLSLPRSGLSWQRRALLVVDLVESVRLIQADERGVIERWCGFVDEVTAQVLPAHGGRMSKSLGDGLLMDFAEVNQAVACAFAVQSRLQRFNLGHPRDLHLCLRMGCHVDDIAVARFDVFGDGVNLASRLCGLAQPGGLVASAAVCEALLDGLDVVIHDLGECFVKHYDAPVRAYQLLSPEHTPPVGLAGGPSTDLRPGIAVVPFQTLDAGSANPVLGDLLADGVIAQLSLARHLRVLSRLSSQVLRGRAVPAEVLSRHLMVQFVLTGTYGVRAGVVELRWTLSRVQAGEVVASGAVSCPVTALLQVDCPAVADLAQQVHAHIVRLAVGRARTRPLPNLESYALLLGGVQLLHRAAAADFARSHELLSHLAQLHPRAAEPRLWLAKWYALRAVQGQTADRAADARRALDCTARVLDADPDDAFGLAMDGFVHCHLTQDYAQAERRLRASVARNPSETFGQLFLGVIHGLCGRFDDGVVAADLALATSPLDPARYLFDSIAAYLHLGAGRLTRAIDLARRSLRQNRLHAHTWRALTIALQEDGQHEEARRCVHQLMDVQPGLTLQTYLAGAQPDDPVRHRFAEALGQAGVPVS